MFALRFLGLVFLVAYSWGMGTEPALNAFGKFIAMLIIVVAPLLYFQPTLEAWLRKQPNLTSIFALNALAGWTLVGWVVAFVWALKRPDVVVASTQAAAEPPFDPWQARESQRKCPFCAEYVKSEAIKCKHCGSDLSSSPA